MAVLLAEMSKQERLILWTGALAGVLVLGAILIDRLDRWRKRHMADRDETPTHVGSFRAMLERGELTQEEYDRVLQRMSRRKGAEPKPAPPPSAAPSTGDTPPAADGPPASA